MPNNDDVSVLGIALFLLWAERIPKAVMRAADGRPPYRTRGPLVSVIVPTYNEEQFLPLTLAAIRNQSYEMLEIVVVDNESTDRTADIAREYGATVVTNRAYNLSMSRNIGARNSSGTFLVFLDADTIPSSLAIERTVEALQSGYVMVETGRCSDYAPHNLGLIALTMVCDPVVAGSTQYVAVTREAFESIGGFDETKLPQNNQSEEKDFVRRMVVAFPGRTKIIRDTYVATSGRRIKAQGITSAKLFQTRAVR